MDKAIKEPKYKFEHKGVKALKDKNETILVMGNNVKDEKGKIWKLQNVTGVAMLQHPITGKVEESIVLSKVDLSEYEKVA